MDKLISHGLVEPREAGGKVGHGLIETGKTYLIRALRHGTPWPVVQKAALAAEEPVPGM